MGDVLSVVQLFLGRRIVRKVILTSNISIAGSVFSRRVLPDPASEIVFVFFIQLLILFPDGHSELDTLVFKVLNDVVLDLNQRV